MARKERSLFWPQFRAVAAFFSQKVELSFTLALLSFLALILFDVGALLSYFLVFYQFIRVIAGNHSLALFSFKEKKRPVNFLKNVALEFRQKKLIAFQILPVLVVLVVVGGLSLGRKDPPGFDGTNSIKVTTPDEAYNFGFFGSGSLDNQWAPFIFADKTGNAGNQVTNSSGPGLLGAIPRTPFRGGQRVPPGSPGEVPYFTGFGTWEEVKSNMTESLAAVVSNFQIQGPYECYSSTQYNADMSQTLVPWRDECWSIYSLPVAGFSFETLSNANGNLSFSYKVDAIVDKPQVSDFFTSPKGQFSNNYYINQLGNQPHASIRLINSAYLRWAMGRSADSFDNFSITAAAVPVNYNLPSTSLKGNIFARELQSALNFAQREFLWSPVNYNLPSTSLKGNIFGQFVLFAVAYSIVLPFFMYRIVVERGSGLMEASRMSGLTATSYWVSLVFTDSVHYLSGLTATSYWVSLVFTDYVHYLVITLILVVLGLIFQFALLLKAPGVLYLLLIFGGFAVLPICYFFAVMFKSLNGAFLFGYIWGLAQALAGTMLNVAVHNAGDLPPGYYMFFPPFALMRSIFVMCHNVAEPEIVSAKLATETALLCLPWMVGFGIIFFLLALYIDQIVPKSEGLKRPFYFPVSDLFGLMGCCSKGKSDLSDDSLLGDDLMSNMEDGMDEDVAKEKSEVAGGKHSSSSTVLLNGVAKSFVQKGGKPFKAVKGVWLHIDKSECFGLLGPNGAGKTTLVNMLVGLTIPSKGQILISGKDSSQNLSRNQSSFEERNIIGLCPQFDILYEDLTVEEHLLFYVRLKGYPVAKEHKHVQAIIDEVGLAPERRRLAGALSGGQKRRLSIGIALAGDPEVVVLDEPTSGLDPGSKRAVWDLIKEARKRRCFLLTTHSMEEAEVLCTRIGIMASGELMCLGTQQHLKSKYGEGFKIDVMYQSGERDKADAFITSSIAEAKLTMTNEGYLSYQGGLAFITSSIPEAKLTMSYEGYLSYQAPKTIKLSQVFTKIESQKRRHGIISWGISQANLEQVFLTIVKHAELGQAGDAPTLNATAEGDK